MTMAQRENPFAHAYTALQMLLMSAHSRQETEIDTSCVAPPRSPVWHLMICGVQI